MELYREATAEITQRVIEVHTQMPVECRLYFMPYRKNFINIPVAEIQRFAFSGSRGQLSPASREIWHGRRPSQGCRDKVES